MKLASLIIAATAAFLSCSVAPSVSAQEPASEPIAAGLIKSGSAVAEVSGVVRDSDRLIVKVRFKPAAEGQKASVEVLYSSISNDSYNKDFYLVSGDKKYLLLKDSAGVPLAPDGVTLQGKGPLLGTWNGVFPAPPAGQKATLFLVGVEPLGPFPVPAE